MYLLIMYQSLIGVNPGKFVADGSVGFLILYGKILVEFECKDQNVDSLERTT